MADNEELVRLVLELTGAKDIDEASTKLGTLKDKLEDTSRASEKLGKQSVNTGQSLLQGGRVLQDFAQGGLGGILNNIEGATMALGLGSGLAGVLTVVGVAALVVGPQIKSFFAGLMDGANQVPKAADAVQALTDSVKKTTDALDEMRKKQSLTNTELAEFNRLSGEEVSLQLKLVAAKKQRAEIDKLAELRPQPEVDAEKERAAELQAGFAGRQDEIAAMIDKNIAGEYKRNIDTATSSQFGSKAHRESHARLAQLEEIKRRGGGKGLAAGAMIAGREQDVRRAMEFLPALEGLPGADVRQGFKEVLPESVARADAEDAVWQQSLEMRSEAVKRRNQRTRAHREAGKLADKLNQQGAKQEEEGNREFNAAEQREGKADFRRFLHRGRASKQKRAANQQRRATQGVQREGFDRGLALSPEQAKEILRQRTQQQQELHRAEAAAMGTILGNQNALDEQIKMWNQIKQQATMQGRTASATGFQN